MKAKNTIKNIFVLSLFIIIIGLFSSCEYKKESDTKTKEVNTNILIGSEKASEVEIKNISENELTINELTIKERESGNFKKIKEGEEAITIESKVSTDPIGDINISPNGGGSIKGGTETGANPLNL